MTTSDLSPWAYPGRQDDADHRDADTWPRHKARQRRRKRRHTSLTRRNQRDGGTR